MSVVTSRKVNLNDDCLLHILRRSQPADVCRVSRTNKRANALVNRSIMHLPQQYVELWIYFDTNTRNVSYEARYVNASSTETKSKSKEDKADHIEVLHEYYEPRNILESWRYLIVDTIGIVTKETENTPLNSRVLKYFLRNVVDASPEGTIFLCAHSGNLTNQVIATSLEPTEYVALLTGFRDSVLEFDASRGENKDRSKLIYFIFSEKLCFSISIRCPTSAAFALMTYFLEEISKGGRTYAHFSIGFIFPDGDDEIMMKIDAFIAGVQEFAVIREAQTFGHDYSVAKTIAVYGAVITIGAKIAKRLLMFGANIADLPCLWKICFGPNPSSNAR